MSDSPPTTSQPDDLTAILEALIFAAEEPLTLEDLRDLFPDQEEESLDRALQEIERSYAAAERGLKISRVAGGFTMTTKPEHGSWVRALFRSRNRRRLSRAALETLAIVAYRQPITTPEIQVFRGTDPSGVLQNLLDKKLVRVLGRKKVVGKPIVYGTTREFLAHFGLNSLEDLPTPEEFGELASVGGLQQPTPMATGVSQERASTETPVLNDEDEDEEGYEAEREDDGDHP
jgi:segregation and condensation protein B